MPKPLPREVTGKPPNTDRDTIATAKRLVQLCSPHLDEAIATVLEVMRDTESRQRLAAASLLIEYARGESTPSFGGGGTKVLVLNSDQVKRMEDAQRQLNQQRIVEAKVMR